MVFNNSTKQFKRYDLMDENVIRTSFFNNKDLAEILLLQISRKVMWLSLLIELVLTYTYHSKGLESLYVYDASCQYYMKPQDMVTELTPATLNKIDEIIEQLPPNVGR